MTIRVKICGISTDAGLDACIEAGVDWVGFVFFARSPRHVTPAQAAGLTHRLPSSIAPVGLFVHPTDDEIDRALAVIPLAVLQIYDDPNRIAALRDRLDLPVWHALPISTATDLPTATRAHGLVIEARAQASDRPGGNGRPLDWNILPGWQAPAPWLLAGGLRPDNVEQAIAASHAPAVDVSSGVETAPGIKSPAAILAFTHAARRAGKAGRDQ